LISFHVDTQLILYLMVYVTILFYYLTNNFTHTGIFLFTPIPTRIYISRLNWISDHFAIPLFVYGKGAGGGLNNRKPYVMAYVTKFYI
jgi:hypothetical protein